MASTSSANKKGFPLQSGLEIGFGFIFTFLNDKHLKFLSLAKPRLGFSTVSLYTFLIKNYGTIPSK